MALGGTVLSEIVLVGIVLGEIVLVGIVLGGFVLVGIVLDGKSTPTPPFIPDPPFIYFEEMCRPPRLFQTPLIFRT